MLCGAYFGTSVSDWGIPARLYITPELTVTKCPRQSTENRYVVRIAVFKHVRKYNTLYKTYMRDYLLGCSSSELQDLWYAKLTMAIKFSEVSCWNCSDLHDSL